MKKIYENSVTLADYWFGVKLIVFQLLMRYIAIYFQLDMFNVGIFVYITIIIAMIFHFKEKFK